jgi:hypothetical protein
VCAASGATASSAHPAEQDRDIPGACHLWRYRAKLPLAGPKDLARQLRIEVLRDFADLGIAQPEDVAIRVVVRPPVPGFRHAPRLHDHVVAFGHDVVDRGPNPGFEPAEDRAEQIRRQGLFPGVAARVLRGSNVGPHNIVGEQGQAAVKISPVPCSVEGLDDLFILNEAHCGILIPIRFNLPHMFPDVSD